LGSNFVKIKYIHRKIGHHAKHSGYDVLFPFMGLKAASSRLAKWLTTILPSNIKWRLHRLRPQQVSDRGLLPELGGLPFTMFGGKRICHFIYGEDTFFYTPLWANKNCILISTYHYPETLLAERVNPATLRCLDAVVIVSNCQRPYFQRFIDNSKIHFIPHHIDTAFFKPPKQQIDSTEHRIITIGHIFRNHSLLNQLIKKISLTKPGGTVHFDLIIPESKHAEFADLKNVNLYSGISDETLLTLYNRATIGFMPLTDCTANNGVLEMMACGLPVVCTDIGGIRDYLDEQGAVLFPADIDADSLTTVMCSLLDNQEQRKTMANYNRNKAQSEFSLTASKTKMLQLYERVLLE